MKAISREILPPTFGFERTLLEDGPLAGRVGRCVTRAVEFLDEHPGPQAVAMLCATLRLEPSLATSVRSRVARLGHVGLLLPAEADAGAIEDAARAAGLAVAGRCPSTILALELGALAGRDIVETTIVRLAGRRSGRRVGVELFVPRAEPALVRGWIADGTGTHAAFDAVSRHALLEIHELLLPSCGRLMPRFTGGRPMENASLGSIVLYYDIETAPEGRRLRIELCHEPEGPEGSAP